MVSHGITYLLTFRNLKVPKSVTTSPPIMSEKDQVLVIEPAEELTFTGRNIEELLIIDFN